MNRYVIHIKLDYPSTFSGAQLDYHSAFGLVKVAIIQKII
jgi:hypothetical protein